MTRPCSDAATAMVNGDWQKVKGILDAALREEPADRQHYIRQACGDDPDLLREVESLFSSLDDSEEFLETPAIAHVADLFAPETKRLEKGRRFSHYEITGDIGAGGMGHVYLAQDLKLDRRVAIKILNEELSRDESNLKRFVREARASSALNHPNIMVMHEIGESEGMHYLVSEFIEGRTLREVLTQSQVSVVEVLEVAIQIAGALSAAHGAHLVHRDIKPENVMVRPDGYIKVLDFGLAKLVEQKNKSFLGLEESTFRLGQTGKGVILGTVHYMSPEQAKGEEVDERTDIFSLGAVMYEMLAGKAPFAADSMSESFANLINTEPQPLSHVASNVPEELQGIVSKTLHKNKDQRYQTMEALLADLRELRENLTWQGKVERSHSRGDKAGPSTARNDGRVAQLIGKFKITNSGAFRKTESIDERNGKKRWRVGFGVAALVLVVVAVMSVASLVRRRGTILSPNESARPSGRALTIRNGYITAARFASDGKGVIYSAGFDGRPVEVFATDIDGSESRPVRIPSAALKDLSATGELAVLLDFELSWNDGRNGTLALVPATGGEPRVLMAGVDEATFAPDGKTLAIVRAEMGQHQLEYPAGQVLYKSLGWISYPRFSRQGDKIAFFEHPLGDNSGSVLVLDLKTKETKALSSGWRALKGLAWSATGDEIWFGGSKASKKQNINGVSLSGQERLNIYNMTSYAKLEDISPEGKLLVSHGNTHTTIVVLTDNSTSETLGTRFAWSTSADISADGQALLFYEWGWESGEKMEVKSTYLRRFDGSEPIRLGEGRALGLSADGNWALAVQEKSPPRLVLLSTQGGKPIELPNPGFKEYHYGSWFPDGRRILFTALEAREEAFLRSYVQDVETGIVHPLTEEGTVALRVSPDGKKVVALDPYGSYSIHSIEGSASETPIAGLEAGDEPIQWSADGRALYVRGPGDFATKLYRVEIAGRGRRMLKEIVPSNPVGLGGIEVKPGGIIITPDSKVCVYTYWTTLQELFLMDSL